MWNRIWQQTMGSNLPFRDRGEWLRWLLATFSFWLLVVTRRLWLNSGEFPQVPWFAWGCVVPRTVDLGLLALLAGSFIAVSCTSSESRGNRLSLWLFAAAFTGLMLLDQHRTQPWAYQFLLIAVVLATASHRLAIPLLRLLTISIYLHSALSKCDYSFCAGAGETFLRELSDPRGFSPDANHSLPLRQPSAWPLIFPLGELLVAIGLIWPSTRRWALWGAAGMHAILIVMLGPWGLGHSAGVLIWNGYFIAQNWILFGKVKIPVNRQETENVSLQRTGWCQWVAIFVTGWATLWPCLEPWGWCDLWPAWGLYAQHGEQLTYHFTRRGRDRLPARWQAPAVESLEENPPEMACQIFPQPIWLELVSAPAYPQNRFQLGVLLGLARDAVIQSEDVSAIWFFPANRWTGERQTKRLSSLKEIEGAANRCWFNAHPRN